MTSGATERDADCLAYLARRIRAETTGCGPWDEVGTVQVFRRHIVGRHLGEMAADVVAHASDPSAKTPAAILRPFRPERAKPSWLPPKAHEACRVCNRHLGACICEQPTTRPIEGTEPTDSYRAAKRLLGRSEA